MKKNNFFAKSLLLTTAMGFFFSPVALNAQEKIVANLSPQGKWNIRDYKDSQGGANSYCALSRAYDQSLVLSLGRNAIKEYSIAIDFQGQKLNTDKAYPITLQPGPGQIRAYEMMPASSNAMVIRLGYDESFFNALTQSGFLTADIAGEKYRFDLDNIEEGNRQLESCLAKIRNEAPVQTATSFKAEKVAKVEKPTKETVKAAPKPELKKVEAKVEPAKPLKEEDKKSPPQESVSIPKAEKVAEATAPKIVPPAPPSEESLKSASAKQAAKAPEAPTAMKAERVVSATKETMPSVPPTPVTQEKLETPSTPKAATTNNAPRIVKEVKVETPDPALLQTIEKLKEQNKTLALALNQEQQKPPVVDQTALQQVEALKEQNKKMAADLAAQQAATAEKEKLAAELAKAEEEKQKLAQSLIEQQEAMEVQKAAAEEAQRKQAEALKIVKEKRQKEQEAQKAATEEAQRKQAEALKLAEEKASKEREAEAQRVVAAEAQRKQEEALKLAEAKAAEQAEENSFKAAEQEMFPKPEQVKTALREKEVARAERKRQDQMLAPKMAQAGKLSKEVDVEPLEAPQPIAPTILAAPPSIDQKPVESMQVEERVAKTPSVNQQLAEKRAMEDRERAMKELAKQRAFEEQVIAQSNNISEKAKQADEKLKKVEEENKKMAMDLLDQQEQLDKTRKDAEKIDPKVREELASIKTENDALEKTLREQEKKLSAFNDKSPEAEAELKAIRDEIAILRIENKKLYDEAREARSKIDTVAVQAGEQALDKIREYERKLEAAQQDNLQLAREVETLKMEQENIVLGALDGDAELESATRRYQEAQREIKRLALLLEQQRSVHIDEKKKLEGMLFDPAVTDQKQREKLAQLERQLANAQARLGGVPPIQVAVNEDNPERVNVYTNRGIDAANTQRDNIQASRMREKLERQEQQLQAYQRDTMSAMAPMLGDTQMAAVPRAPVTAQPLSDNASAPYNNIPSIESRPGMVVSAQQSSSPVAQNIQNALDQAGLTLRNGVSQQANNRYRWSVGNMVGSAEIQNSNQAGNIQNFIQMYITRAQQRCNGDFASLPGIDNNTFEIACISPSRNSSAAILFTKINNDFVAIAHETSADDMDVAMDARDRIAGVL